MSEQIDRATGSEGTALGKVNGSVNDIFKAVAESGKEVKEMRMLGGYGSRQEVKTHWSEFLQKKRNEDRLVARMVYVGDVKNESGVQGPKGGEDGVTFTSKVNKGNDESGCYNPLFPG